MKLNKNDLKKAIREEIIEILSGGDNSMNEETRSVGPMTKSNEFEVGDKVKYKGMNHEITRIIDDRIYIKNLKYGGRPDTWVKAVDLKKSMKESSVVVDKNTNPTSITGKDPNTVKTAIDNAKKTGKPVTIAEEDEDEMDKKATKAASSGKKDSIVSLANQLVKIATEMKSLAKEYKSAKEGKETEKEKEILSKLKELTSQKKKIESKLTV
jgi:hypothetical protein